MWKRASKRQAKLRDDAVVAQGGLCFYCCGDLEKFHRSADHVVSRANGGRTNRVNIVAACKQCNKRKATMTAEEFLASEAFVGILVGRGFFRLIKRSRR